MNYFDQNAKVFKELEAQFEPFTVLRGDDLKQFLSRVSLSTVRASAGVLVFLETKSVEAMAKALGHAKYDANLLSHYLPDALIEFFQSRWIRIFQKAIIYHAMKDSPLLLETIEFSTLLELNEFLKNHALKDIPDCDSEDLYADIEKSNKKSQVFIQINVGILTTLLSLQRATEYCEKSRKICGISLYWAQVTDLVRKNIENGNDRQLKEHLKVALKNSDPKKMEKLIYATC